MFKIKNALTRHVTKLNYNTLNYFQSAMHALKQNTLGLSDHANTVNANLPQDPGLNGTNGVHHMLNHHGAIGHADNFDAFPFMQRLQQISQSANKQSPQSANQLNSIFQRVEHVAPHTDSPADCGEDDGLYLSRSQRSIMDKLIADRDENEAMNSFYMVDLGDIVRQHLQWVTLLPHVYPFYAVKCNPDPVIIALLSYLGCSFDCASENEIRALMQAGVDTTAPNAQNGHIYDKVIFSHPCKHPLHLAYGQQVGVNLCTFDNEDELHKISKFHPNCKAMLRIQVDDSQSICKFNSKYGYNVDDVKDVHRIFDLARELGTNLNGIMFHVGSGCLDANVYETAIEKAKFLLDIAHNEYGYDISQMNTLDLGGGFPGVNDKEHGVEFPEIARVINKALRYYFGEFGEHPYRFIAEPGRYYVARSHSLVCDIIAKKKLQSVSGEAANSVSVSGESGKDQFMYYLNDGMYGSFNCIYFDHQYPAIVPYARYVEHSGVEAVCDKKYKTTIFGPTCDSMDKMYDGYELEELNIMDKVVIPFFGAYTNAAASGFNGFEKSKSRYVITL
jgi:ornithine decarboxylase